MGSDAAPEDNPEDLSRISRIPDFGMFYTKDNKRLLPLIIEIKAVKGNNPRRAIENMIRQTLVQARHVFDIYGGHKNLRGPPTCRLYVFCVVGVKFWMYSLERGDMPFLPFLPENARVPEAKDVVESLQVTRFIKMIRSKVEVWPVFNAEMTNYSYQFRNCWHEFTEDLPADGP